jgi:hypothetical protein
MSLSEQEKNNLVNDGKFTQQQVDFFSDNGIRYDVIKNLQSVTQEHIETRNRRFGETYSLALEDINSLVNRYIQGCVNQLQRDRQAQHSSRRNINSYVNDVTLFYAREITDINAFVSEEDDPIDVVDVNASSDDAEENASLGGKRRKTRRSKRRLRTRRRRKRRSSRAKKITKTR